MTESRPPEKQRADIESVLKEFDDKQAGLIVFGDKTKILLDEILRAVKIHFHSIQARVKLRNKLKEKYLDPQKDYALLDDITDQVALRVITYYEDEVDRVAEVVRREFTIDTKNSVDKRDTEPDRFGYFGLNFVCKYSTARTTHTEYKKFADVWFEIQITSILRHAWSEIEHPWYDLKGAFPDIIKRRFARMAALLEIAETEFLSLRKLQSDYQQSIAVQVGANVSDLPVDAVSMKAFIEQDALVAEIDATISAIRGLDLSPEVTDKFADRSSRAANLAGMTTLQNVRDSLKKYGAAISEYARRRERERDTSRNSPQVLDRGISIRLLSHMLVNLRGAKATANYYKELNLRPGLDIHRQVAIAKLVMAKPTRSV